MTGYADHIALVRQIDADAGHIPQDAIDAWQQAGPLKVRAELAGRFQQLADRGLSRIDDAERAARHFGLLVTVSNPSRAHAGISEEEAAEMVTSGVRVFLHGYVA
ncbi:TetR/AcrR family transcriptional regulator C-terminal domain-containing protein [Streptomyces sp. A5-4]|uniref:TetR/AcrR family transcriptional regulator C-terminal domain-containing protein n=1 Tax=Streptomyces sp. A5-4 TaxID=3384771 RepID=UPI003DAA017B